MKSLFLSIRKRYRKLKTKVMIYHDLLSIQDMSIAHYNNKLPLIRHLEGMANQTRKIDIPEISFSDNLSPIPRHDMTDFNRLTTIRDLYKNHPNPKMEGSPFTPSTITSNNLEKYQMLFTRISLTKPDQDDF